MQRVSQRPIPYNPTGCAACIGVGLAFGAMSPHREWCGAMRPWHWPPSLCGCGQFIYSTIFSPAQAAGICERCIKPRPFKRKKGSPYLEPHHTRRNSDAGPDHLPVGGHYSSELPREVHEGELGRAKNHALMDRLRLRPATLSLCSKIHSSLPSMTPWNAPKWRTFPESTAWHWRCGG